MSSKSDFTTGRELKELFNDEIKILTYPDLLNYRSIEEVLEPYGRAIILYEFLPNVGHWIAVSMEFDPETDTPFIRFFDPFGLKPDDQQQLINPEFRKKRWDDLRYLSNLLKHCPWEIDYNEYPLQSMVPGIGTCGRWCAARLKLNELSTDEFWELFKSDDDVNSDDLVVDYYRSLK